MIYGFELFDIYDWIETWDWTSFLFIYTLLDIPDFFKNVEILLYTIIATLFLVCNSILDYVTYHN